MKIQFFLPILLVVSVFFQPIFSQENTIADNKWYWGVYASAAGFPDSELKSFDFIRRDMDSDEEYYHDYVYGTMHSWKLGLNIEKRIMHERLSISSGVHFVRLTSGFEAEDYSSTSNFMLINISEEANVTSFLRVTDFSQNTNYIGTHLKAKFVVFSRPITKFYLSSGVNVDFRLDSDMQVNFLNSAMDKYELRVSNLFSEPKNINSSIDVHAGIRLGRVFKVNAELELGPSFLLTNNQSSLSSATVAFNYQLNINLPF